MKKLLTTLTLSSLLLTPVAQAETNTDDTNANESKDTTQSDEQSQKLPSELKEKLFGEGADLTAQQKEETRDLLDVSNGYKTYDITVDDVYKQTGIEYDTIQSSVAITPKKLKHGIDVDIVTPENIERTKSQYENASITAGLQDVDIKVGSVDKVTGDGALTGIYYMLEQEGYHINSQDVQNANDEMNSLAKISNENQNDKGYSDDALNGSVAEMKSKVAEEKQKDGDVTDEDVDKITDETLKEHGLDESLSDEQINEIKEIMRNTAESQAINNNPENYQKQADSLKSHLSGAIDKAQDELKGDVSLGSKIKQNWEKFKSWVGSLF